MKSKIKGTEQSEYPCLKKCTLEGIVSVVLFDKPSSGMLVYSYGASYHHLGDYCETWIECHFEKTNETIELSNN